MRKSIEFLEVAESHESKSEYWERKANDINCCVLALEKYISLSSLLADVK